jgi:aminoglycoside phosphotransferase (APT) family kinase protein
MNLTPATAIGYLRSCGHLGPHERAQARELSGGVSNVVVHVARTDGEDLVMKQGRERLNVAEPWFCSVERIWREVDVLRHCARLIPSAGDSAPMTVGVPKLLFEDRENHLYAMSAAPAGHVVWKNELLSGIARRDVARSCGVLLGCLHSKSWHDADLARELDDRQYFEALRIDPYYRQIAHVHPSLAPAIERLIESVRRERKCLVHGDYSPKNLLVHEHGLMLIDFEVGHYGDPAFDLGFFLSHLMLKAFYHSPGDEPYFELIEAFWSGYCGQLAGIVTTSDLNGLARRSILNFAGCALARLDGKSKIDYLNDAGRREAMRTVCRTIFAREPEHWADVRRLAEETLKSGKL